MCVPTLQMDNLTPKKLSDLSKVALIHRRWNWKLRPAGVPRLLGNREFLFFPFLVSMETDLGTHPPAQGTVMTSCLWDARRDCAALWAVAQPPGGGAHPHFWLCTPKTHPHSPTGLGTLGFIWLHMCHPAAHMPSLGLSILHL